MNNDIKAIPIPQLCGKRKYLIHKNNVPILICGKKHASLVMQVLHTGTFIEDFPLNKGEQGRILKLARNINKN